MTEIIALNSLRGRSGKDTLFEVLVEHGVKIRRVAFGDKLKEICSQNIALARSEAAELEAHMHTDEKDVLNHRLAIVRLPDNGYKRWLTDQNFAEAAPRSLRWHLQQYGTEYRRKHLNDPDVWFREGLKEIAKTPEGEICLVTDMRQLNEYLKLVEMGAKTVFLLREWYVQGVDDAALHETDTALLTEPFDASVINRWGDQQGMYRQLVEQGVLK